jgi:L-alanine-DL-glutamate epimerase-like enolase superfamily enzyme
MRIERVDVHRLAISLERPYKLAFGPVDRYDTVLVTLEASQGDAGVGEATLLTGYTDETIDEAWTLSRDIARALPGVSFADARARLIAIGARAPFAATAFHTALDMAEGHPLLVPRAGTRVPILGLLQGDDAVELRERFDTLLAQGYRSVKVKVGFDVAQDLAFVARVQAVVAGRAPIRVDANQGYSARAAAEFVAGVDPAGIELFEQPCAAGDWDAQRQVATAARRSGLPLMLDESIYGLADIERAAAEGACTYVKVKLMKFVGLGALVAAIERIRALGMRPVLGNGVACDVSCWMEACVAARYIDNAGEMNGFQKARRMLFRAPLVFDRGDIVLDGARPELDADALAAYRVDHASFALARSAATTIRSP